MNRVVITGLVILHLGASVWHGGAHTQLAITLPPEKNIFVYVVILIAPIVAAALVWTRYLSIGLWVFFLSMLGSFLFGAYHHYVVVSPDNIGHLPGSSESHSQFITSAAVIALLELASALYGAFCLGSRRTQSSTRLK
jgi:NADPH:quinone reductase-like Zn-dependent oxidoreductase